MAKAKSRLKPKENISGSEVSAFRKGIFAEERVFYDVLVTLLLFGLASMISGVSYLNIHWLFWWIVSVVMLSGAYVRLFLLGHEMFHMGNLRLQKVSYKILRYIIGTVTLSPIIALRRSHQIHHSFNCNWSIYKGPMLIVEEEQLKMMTDREKMNYCLTRRVELVWLTGLVAHVVIPRIRLIRHFCVGRIDQREEARGILWYSQVLNGLLLDMSSMEVIDTLAVTIGSLVLLWLLIQIDPGLILVYATSVLVGQSIIILIIHMQHTFPGSYAASLDVWDRQRLTDGTANINLGRIGNWLTADFAVYHVQHHMQEAVGWRNLSSIDFEWSRIKTLRFNRRTIYECFALLVWSKERSTFCRVEEIS